MMTVVPSPTMSSIMAASPNLTMFGNSIVKAGSSFFLKRATSSTLGPEGSLLPLTRPLLPPTLSQLSTSQRPTVRESTDSLPPRPPAPQAEQVVPSSRPSAACLKSSYIELPPPSTKCGQKQAILNVVTIVYAAVAVSGFLMFGESTMSQFTLNMPQQYIPSKIAIWMTIVNPYTKYALTITPVALSIEEALPKRLQSYQVGMCVRTALVISTVVVALTFPYFALVMALLGSVFTMLVALILPCACYLSIKKGSTPLWEKGYMEDDFTTCILQKHKDLFTS
ncbi:hypothetical protein ABZP36_033544 [Zizania latifolia]